MDIRTGLFSLLFQVHDFLALFKSLSALLSPQHAFFPALLCLFSKAPITKCQTVDDTQFLYSSPPVLSLMN